MACKDQNSLLEKNRRVSALLEKTIQWLPLEEKEAGVSSGNVGL